MTVYELQGLCLLLSLHVGEREVRLVVRLSRKADTANALVKALMAAEDIDFDA